MKTFVLLIREADLETLGAVRCLPELQAARHEGYIWLHGPITQEQLPLVLRQLPAKQSFMADATGQLFPPAALSPVGTLPALDWQPLPVFLPVELPVSALPAKLVHTVPLRVVAAHGAENSAALKTRWALWAHYVETAPLARLQRLRFAASEQGDALILGNPLPPLPGQSYWFGRGLLLPAGFDLEFPALAEVFIHIHNPSNDYLLLLEETGTWEKIHQKHLQAATRSAVRQTPIP